MGKNRLILHRQSNSFRTYLNLFSIAVGRDNQEFLSAVATYQIIGSDGLLHTSRSLNEDIVSGQMPIGVVYLLEVIQIEHDDTDRASGARCKFILAMQQVQNCTSIPGSREAITGCLHAEFFPGFQLFVLEGQDSPSRPQSGAQFVPIEGLGEIVVRAGLQSPDEILFVILGSYQQDVLVGGACTLANQTAQVNAIQVGHDPVQNQQVGCTYLLQDLPCFCTILRDSDLIAPTFQPTAQYLAEHRIVFGNQNPIACRPWLFQSQGLWLPGVHHGLTHGLTPGEPGVSGSSELVFCVKPIELSNRAIAASKGGSRTKAP